MSLSTLDLKTALIVIDLQKGTVSLPLVHTVTEVVSNARALARRIPQPRASGRARQCFRRSAGANGGAAANDELPNGMERSSPRVEPTAH